MRKTSVALVIFLLAASCFTVLISQAVAQSTDPSTPPITPPPLIIRWMRYQGTITQLGSDSYKGSITVNAKTANAPPPVFKPWVTVDAFWSNQPPFPHTKPAGGQYTFTSYNAKLVKLLSIRKQDDMIVNVTGLWNINKVVITTKFDQNGNPIDTVREVTPITTQALGQLHITPDWKNFTIVIDRADSIQGLEISMMTTTNMMNPFSYGGSPSPTVKDLTQLMGSFRAMPGLGNYIPELDYNKDSKIDMADLTTVASNM